MGYSQWNNLPGIQIAALVGVHGISFVIVLFNAGIATLIWNRHQWRQEIGGVILPLILILFCFGYGILQLQNANPLDQDPRARDQTNVETLKVALIPGNIPQLQKWDLRQFPKILQRYIGLTHKATGADPALIVWPRNRNTK